MEVEKHGKTLPLVLSILPALMAIVVIPYTVFTLRKFFKISKKGQPFYILLGESRTNNTNLSLLMN